VHIPSTPHQDEAMSSELYFTPQAARSHKLSHA